MKRLDDIPHALLIPTTPPGQRLAIRQARRGDLKVIYDACFAERSLAQFGDSFRRSLDEQEAGRRLHLVAFDGDDLVASGQLTRFSNLLEISDLAVAETHRGLGIGTALISVFEKIARYTGFDTLEIGVMKENHRARALYQRLGYVEDRELRLGKAATALVLRKVLREQ